MKIINNKELREIIQSGHINLFVGSGASLPYLSTLNNIEQKMDDESTKEEAQKEYYGIIKKSKAIIDESKETDSREIKSLRDTKQNYDKFISFWTEAITNRHLSIVNKQVNIFTTNFDMFIEDACERLGIPYNDGFAGQLNPKFSVSNFNKIQKYKSLQFDNTSDIPLFNIIKIHGSFSWKAINDNIIYSKGSHIADDLAGKSGKEFINGYSRIAVVNPNAEKHFATVLDTNYASLLRKFTLELEKENSALFIFGFSLKDKHIKDLLYNVMKSNPTLIVVFFSFSHYDKNKDEQEEARNSNLYIIGPESDKEMQFSEQTDFLRNALFSTESKSEINSSEEAETEENDKDE